jgi:nitrous oxidase accessory protein NosD
VKAVFIIFLLIVSIWVGIFGFTSDASGQSVIIVPQDYGTIQQAINNAGAGDTIQVWAGTYTENIIVFKRLSIIGNGTTNTIIDGSISGDVVRISANNVIIQGFTITGSGIVSTNAGIKLVTITYQITIMECIYRHAVIFQFIAIAS